MNRRTLLFLAASTAISACGRNLKPTEIASRSQQCFNPKSNSVLKIDAHCHLLNAKDVDGATFVIRRYLKSETSEVARRPGIAGIISQAALRTKRVAREKDELSREILRWAQGELDFEEGKSDRIWPDNPEHAICRSAYKKHYKQDLISEFGFEGFTSARLKNAADMMSKFPSVHLFTPALIDFYEGNSPYDPVQEARFYAALNLATDGRFVPLIGFNPERQFDDVEDGRKTKDDLSYVLPLDMVEIAIRDLGFIGVKLHPSTGFSPIENKTYGCLNTRDQKENNKRSLKDEIRIKERFEAYDEYMTDLFMICMRYDAPVLVHGGKGLDTNKICSDNGRTIEQSNGDFKYRPNTWKPTSPSEQTNSPDIWARTISKMNKEASRRYKAALKREANGETDEKTKADLLLKGRKLRVCLAHMAGGIDTSNGFADSPWLSNLIKLISSTPGLYADFSEMSDIMGYSKSLKNGPISAVHRLFRNTPSFGSRTLYGSDFHMPGASRNAVRYIAESKRLIPSRYHRAVFGGNAVEFYGLGLHTPARKRMKEFYTTSETRHVLFGRNTNPKLLAKTVIQTARIPWWSLAAKATR